MTRFAVATITLTVLISSFALAQDATPKVQVFGGYSFVYEDSGGLSLLTVDLVLPHSAGSFGLDHNFKGWSAEAQYNASRWIGIAADFGGRYGTPITTSTSGVSGLPNSTAYSVLAGPVVTYRNKSRITPFAHALFGWDRTSLSASTLTGVSPPVSYASETYNDFAMALGAGADLKLSRRFAIRLGQLDYFHTTVNLNKVYGTDFNSHLFQGFPTHQVNLRLSAGIVARF